MLTSTVNTLEVASAAADSYTFNYAIHKASDLVAYIDGTSTATNDGTNPYTVTVAANKASATIAFTNTGNSAPHRGKALKFERIVEYKQETDLANNSLLDAESLETSLDNIVMQTQQAGLKADVSFGFDPGIAATDFNSTASYASTLRVNKATRASKALAFDTNGDITVSTDDIDAQISAVAASASAASTSATASASSATASAASLAEFQGIYRGSSTSTPGSPTDGDLWFDTNTGINLMKVYNATGTAWEQLTPTSSNQTNINAAVADATDIGVVAGKETEIGRLGTADTVADMVLLGTTDCVADMAILATTDIVADMALLGTTDCVADMALLATTDCIADMAILATTDIVADMAILGTADIVADMALLGTTDCVADMALLATTDCIADMAILGTAAIVEDMSHLGTADVVADLAILATSANVTNMATLGASGVVADIAAVAGKATEVGRLGTADAVADLAILGTSAIVADLDALADVDSELALLGTSAMAHASSGHLALLGTSTVVANIATVAGSIADVNRYANEYKIASSAPGSPSEGDMWSDTTNKTFKVYNGTSWATVTEGQSAEEVNATSISMAIALG